MALNNMGLKHVLLQKLQNERVMQEAAQPVNRVVHSEGSNLDSSDVEANRIDSDMDNSDNSVNRCRKITDFSIEKILDFGSSTDALQTVKSKSKANNRNDKGGWACAKNCDENRILDLSSRSSAASCVANNVKSLAATDATAVSTMAVKSQSDIQLRGVDSGRDDEATVAADILVKPKVLKYWGSAASEIAGFPFANGSLSPHFALENLSLSLGQANGEHYYKSVSPPATVAASLLHQNYYYHYYNQQSQQHHHSQLHQHLQPYQPHMTAEQMKNMHALCPVGFGQRDNRLKSTALWCSPMSMGDSVRRNFTRISCESKVSIRRSVELTSGDLTNSGSAIGALSSLRDGSSDKFDEHETLKSNQMGLHRHMRSKQSNAEGCKLLSPMEDELCFRCHICDKVFGCSNTLQTHVKTHKSPRYECLDCGKGFSQLRNYKYHLSVHRGTKEFAAECPECGKVFNDKGYLSSHMKIHRNKKEYQCPYCPKSFNQRVAFNMHVRIHTGVKPHKCAECGKRFSRKMLLKQHMRTHSGEKPYTCSVCGKSFADRSNMTLHHRLHSGIKPFTCPICPKAFTKKHHLKTHLNYHTGCKPYVCPHANCNQAFTQSSNMRTHAKKCQFKPPADDAGSKASNNRTNGNNRNATSVLRLYPEVNNNLHLSHEAILV